MPSIYVGLSLLKRGLEYLTKVDEYDLLVSF